MKTLSVSGAALATKSYLCPDDNVVAEVQQQARGIIAEVVGTYLSTGTKADGSTFVRDDMLAFYDEQFEVNDVYLGYSTIISAELGFDWPIELGQKINEALAPLKVTSEPYSMWAVTVYLP